MAVVWKQLLYDGDAVLKALFAAQSILAAVSDDTPAALEIAEQTIVGRITSGNIAALTATQVRTLLNVADGADVTGSNAPQAHAASHKNGGTDEILLNELGEPTGAIEVNGQEVQNLVAHQVADEAARLGLTPVVGKLAFQVDELSAYICTSAA